MEDFAIDVAMLDWIRCTDWKAMISEDEFTQVDNQRSVRRLNYFGEMYDGIFHGMGWQNNRHHFMKEITGDRSDAAFGKFPELAKCTRLDIQVTRKMRWNTIFKMASQLREANWHGRQRKIRLESNDGFDDTIYVGVRKNSPLFIRIYAKGEPDNQFVRFEAEFKVAGSVGAWASLHDGVTKAEILAQVIWGVPQVSTMKPFHEWASEWEHYHGKPIVKAKSRKKWITNTVIPALWKAANGHGDKEWLVEELERLLSHMRTNA